MPEKKTWDRVILLCLSAAEWIISVDELWQVGKYMHKKVTRASHRDIALQCGRCTYVTMAVLEFTGSVLGPISGQGHRAISTIPIISYVFPVVLVLRYG